MIFDILQPATHEKNIPVDTKQIIVFPQCVDNRIFIKSETSASHSR